MKLPLLYVLLTASVATNVTHAQEITRKNLITGYVYDSVSRGLRAIVGVPGAAYLSSAIISDIDGVWPSPDRTHAVGIRSGETILYTALDSLEPHEFPVEGLIANATQVYWSSSGQFGVLYSETEGSLQSVEVTNDVVTAQVPVSVRSGGGSVSSLAVSNSGRITFSVGDSIYSVEETGIAHRGDLSQAAALTYCDDGRLYASGSGGLFELIPDGSAQIRYAADLIIPALSCAGTRVLAIHPQQPAVVVYENGTTTTVVVDRQPSTLQVLQSRSIFLLNALEGTSRPPVVLNMNGSPGVFFIPSGDPDAL